MNHNLLQYCSHAKEREDFVGIRLEYDEKTNKSRPYIIFPYGYNYTSNDDILVLIKVLKEYQHSLNIFGTNQFSEEQTKPKSFPIKSYIFIIQDYLNNGYYTEREAIYASRTHGKVNWGRTIKKEKPVVQKNGAIYLNLQTRLHHSNDEHIMTEISQHCVYESFIKFAWYYGLSTPTKPQTKLRKTRFLAVLIDKLHRTNKDLDKQLFQSMIDVLDNIEETDKNQEYFTFGTNRFEMVWENLIDRIFGTEHGIEKSKYFPKANWYIFDNEGLETNPLVPDTIMINHDTKNLYVIDAKYYRYGITSFTSHLPNMSSIAKQITYAQFINSNFSFKKVRNVFILPFNSNENNLLNYKCSGWALANWVEDACDYKKIYIILVDTKHLMKNTSLANIIEIKNLSDIIEKYDKNSKST